MIGLIALWQVLRMYDVGGKLLNRIKSMYVNSLTYVRVKGAKRECFRIDIGVNAWVYHVPLAFQCIYGCSGERSENGDGEEGIDISVVGWRGEIFLASCM